MGKAETVIIMTMITAFVLVFKVQISEMDERLKKIESELKNIQTNISILQDDVYNDGKWHKFYEETGEIRIKENGGIIDCIYIEGGR